jgi:hypothetical protein
MIDQEVRPDGPALPHRPDPRGNQILTAADPIPEDPYAPPSP